MALIMRYLKNLIIVSSIVFGLNCCESKDNGEGENIMSVEIILPGVQDNSTNSFTSFNNGTIDASNPDPIPVLADGVINDGDLTYLFMEVGQSLGLTRFFFNDFLRPFNALTDTLEIVYNLKLIDTTSVDVDFEIFVVQEDAVSASSIPAISITDVNFNIDGTSSPFPTSEYVEFSSFINITSLNAMDINTRQSMGITFVLENFTGGAGKEIRITNIFLRLTRGNLNDSKAPGNSFSVGETNAADPPIDIGSGLALIDTTLNYLGDYGLIVLSSPVMEQPSSSIGFVSRGLKGGGVSSLYIKNLMNVSVNCIVLADTDSQYRERIQAIKRAFSGGLDFISFDINNFDLDSNFRKGFYGLLVSTIEGRRVGLHNREINLNFSVPDGFWQSILEFENTFTFDKGDDTFSPTELGIHEIPIPTGSSVSYPTGNNLNIEEFGNRIGGDFIPISRIELSRGSGTLPAGDSTFQIKNETRDEELIWTGDFSIGSFPNQNVLTIDSFNEKVFITDGSGIITDVTSGITSNSVFPKLNINDFEDPDNLTPISTPNRDTFLIQSNWDDTTAELRVSFKWRRRF